MAPPPSSPARRERGPSYASLAFHNPANYLFLGTTALATLTLWGRLGLFPLIVGGGLELLWLVVGAELPFARRRLDARRAAAEAEAEAERQRALLGALGEGERRRYFDLVRLQGEIARDLEANPSLVRAGLERELTSLARLPTQFLTTAHEAARLGHFVAQTDLGALERQVRTQGLALEQQTEPEARALAQKNLAVLEQRIERARDVHKAVRVARAQLNLIENTMRLVRDQIMTLGSPVELAQQLEALSTSVEALATRSREGDAAIQKWERELAGELSR